MFPWDKLVNWLFQFSKRQGRGGCLKPKITPETHNVCLEKGHCLILRNVQGGRFPQIKHTPGILYRVFIHKSYKAPPNQYNYSACVIHIDCAEQAESSTSAWGSQRVSGGCLGENTPRHFVLLWLSEDTRVLVFLPTACFTVDVCPWLSKSVNIRCSLSGTLVAIQILFRELVTILKS